jgi:hypothetical protein
LKKAVVRKHWRSGKITDKLTTAGLEWHRWSDKEWQEHGWAAAATMAAHLQATIKLKNKMAKCLISG